MRAAVPLLRLSPNTTCGHLKMKLYPNEVVPITERALKKRELIFHS